MPRTEDFDRALVLEKTKHVFWNKGFNGTSMQDLVDATGLNRSSIYNSFGSKKELFNTVLEHYQRESGRALNKALARAENPLQAIQYILEDIVTLIEEDEEGKGCFNLNCKSELSRTQEDIHKYLCDTQDEVIRFFKDLVEEGQRDGVINERDTSENYAYYIFSGFQGLRMTGMLMKEHNKLHSIVRNTLKTLA